MKAARMFLWCWCVRTNNDARDKAHNNGRQNKLILPLGKICREETIRSDLEIRHRSSGRPYSVGKASTAFEPIVVRIMASNRFLKG